MAPDTERAWAAGFFDGEGSVVRTLNLNGRVGVPTVAITQAGMNGTPDTLVRFCAAVEVAALIRGPMLAERRKPRYQVAIQSYANVIKVRDALWPWLSSDKREAFSSRLAEYEAKRADSWRGSKPWTHCKQGHPLTDGSVYFNNKGGRQCRECQLTRARARRTATA